MKINFVTVKKLSELFGYSEKAIRNKIDQGVWQKQVHWTKAPDGRVFLNAEAIEQWIKG